MIVAYNAQLYNLAHGPWGVIQHIYWLGGYPDTRTGLVPKNEGYSFYGRRSNTLTRKKSLIL